MRQINNKNHDYTLKKVVYKNIGVEKKTTSSSSANSSAGCWAFWRRASTSFPPNFRCSPSSETAAMTSSCAGCSWPPSAAPSCSVPAPRWWRHAPSSTRRRVTSATSSIRDAGWRHRSCRRRRLKSPPRFGCGTFCCGIFFLWVSCNFFKVVKNVFKFVYKSKNLA